MGGSGAWPGRRPGRDQRGMILAVALTFLVVLAVLAMALLTAAQTDRFNSFRVRSRTEAFYVADGGLQGVLATLKSNASNVVAATYPVVPGLLINAVDWGFTAQNYPGGITFNNMPGGRFTPNDSTSNVVVTLPRIGRGTAQVTVWLKSVGATLADPVVFGVSSVGTLPTGTRRTVTADVTLAARGGRPPNPIQTGGLGGPVLGFLQDGGTSISGTVQRGGATVAIQKRVGNMWVEVGRATAGAAPAGMAGGAAGGGASPFTLNLSTPLVRGETYSAKSQDSASAPWSPLAFPAVVQ